MPIRIVNPHTDKHYNTRGVIDTGADECSIPAKIANILGHNLKAGNVNVAGAAGGDCMVYSHTTTIEILHPDTNNVVYKIEMVSPIIPGIYDAFSRRSATQTFMID